ncbi:MAG: M14 family zinc carboxypeptidase, partial [Acidobacteriota bacterium]|nr:M14 family zinc carboxypeptidase [Acidobacteriota bacterium]
MAIRPIPGRKTALALLCVLALPLAAPAQTSPESFLGHRPGEDRKLADYAQIQAYFQKLDEESGRLRLLTIGTSTLGKPMIMAAITAEENMDKLDAYRKIAYQLKEARGLTPGQAAELAREGKVILLITNNIHASEIASSQTAMELAYDLV